ncbi:putative DREV methyltransferase [Heterostelium album PN500]|uniref:Putative DREV methyltransferase n=1 Tax=Heterostelium pallidum (strain ATCC 26659 / Pp 5 / PN500) TaxID=670386 RepID=D3BKH0_HETP5|nr:putative DREV methyltransferase [Heterostelium album PN500]EFA78400.1 putative DREV methyltransferase [Heterostelium album PN500]|eukprot:XP_020430525.1 putative DREV methyltransferase [Heterostelium album PN500]
MKLSFLFSIILCIIFSNFLWWSFYNNNNNNSSDNNIIIDNSSSISFSDNKLLYIVENTVYLLDRMRSLRNLAMELMKEDNRASSPALFNKLKREYSKYYHIKHPENFKYDHASRFVQTSFDQETCQFIIKTPRWNAVTSGLNWLMMWYYTKTDSMGYIGMGNMFILSTDQYRLLFRQPSSTSSPLLTSNTENNNNDNNNDGGGGGGDSSIKSLVRYSSLLDVGSGCGATTQQLQPMFKEVVATEASSGMIYSLKKKGITAIYCTDLEGCKELEDRRNSFDVVSCLNVLDRCERPITLLQQMKQFIKPGGRLLLAVVYPFKPYVEFGGNNNKPFEKLNINNNSIEEYISSMISNVFEPIGFKTESFTKAPYISEGDKYYDNYVLVDTLFVLSVMPENEQSNSTINQ